MLMLQIAGGIALGVLAFAFLPMLFRVAGMAISASVAILLLLIGIGWLATDWPVNLEVTLMLGGLFATPIAFFKILEHWAKPQARAAAAILVIGIVAGCIEWPGLAVAVAGAGMVALTVFALGSISKWLENRKARIASRP